MNTKLVESLQIGFKKLNEEDSDEYNERLKEIARDGKQLAFSNSFPTYCFHYFPQNKLLVGSWEANHFDQCEYLTKHEYLDLSQSIKGRLTKLNGNVNFVFLISAVGEKLYPRLPEWTITNLKRYLERETKTHIDIIVDDHQQVLSESTLEQKRCFENKDWSNYIYLTYPTVRYEYEGLKESKFFTSEEEFNTYWECKLFDPNRGKELFRRNSLERNLKENR